MFLVSYIAYTSKGFALTSFPFESFNASIDVLNFPMDNVDSGPVEQELLRDAETDSCAPTSDQGHFVLQDCTSED